MCFSAEVDLVAGVLVGGVGIDALRHVRRPAERALAAIPVVLGAHQLVEAVVWSTLDGQVAHSALAPALFVYLTIAFGVLPVLVPIAVGALEPAAHHRRVGVLTAVGAVVAATLMLSVIRGPVDATIGGRHIAYRVDLWQGGLIVALYVLATCGSLLVSHVSHVRWFGAVNVVVVGALAWLAQSALISLWCAWAAITSVAIAIHLRRRPAEGAPVENGLVEVGT